MLRLRVPTIEVGTAIERRSIAIGFVDSMAATAPCPLLIMVPSSADRVWSMSLRWRHPGAARSEQSLVSSR